MRVASCLAWSAPGSSSPPCRNKVTNPGGRVERAAGPAWAVFTDANADADADADADASADCRGDHRPHGAATGVEKRG